MKNISADKLWVLEREGGAVADRMQETKFLDAVAEFADHLPSCRQGGSGHTVELEYDKRLQGGHGAGKSDELDSVAEVGDVESLYGRVHRQQRLARDGHSFGVGGSRIGDLTEVAHGVDSVEEGQLIIGERCGEFAVPSDELIQPSRREKIEEREDVPGKGSAKRVGQVAIRIWRRRERRLEREQGMRSEVGQDERYWSCSPKRVSRSAPNADLSILVLTPGHGLALALQIDLDGSHSSRPRRLDFITIDRPRCRRWSSGREWAMDAQLPRRSRPRAVHALDPARLCTLAARVAPIAFGPPHSACFTRLGDALRCVAGGAARIVALCRHRRMSSL
jgi:hypothetical protein